MSKTNGKQVSAADNSTNPDGAQTSTAAAAPADNAGTVVQSASTSQAQPPVTGQGRGGHYRLQNGVRTLVHRTLSEEEAAKAEAKGADGDQADPA